MYQIKMARFDNKKLLKYVNIKAPQLDGTIDYLLRYCPQRSILLDAKLSQWH